MTYIAKVTVDGFTQYGSLDADGGAVYFAPVGTPPPVNFDDVRWVDASSIIAARPNPWVEQFRARLGHLTTPASITYPKARP